MNYFETILLSILTGLILWRLKEWIAHKINPDIRLKKAPRNILKHITPGVTVEKVKDLLGSPYYDYQNRLIYRFKYVNVELRKEDGKISTIILVLKNFGFRRRYPIHPLDFKLGKVKVGDIFENQKNVGVDTSSKSGKIWIERYFGNPGYYWHYTFGIFDGPGAKYPYQFPEFSVEEQKIFGDFKDLKVNYVAVSNKEDSGGHFDFYAMR